MDGRDLLRLKSCHGRYLTVPHRLNSSVEWEPIREGFQVKLKARYGHFLRGGRTPSPTKSPTGPPPIKLERLGLEAGSSECEARALLGEDFGGRPRTPQLHPRQHLQQNFRQAYYKSCFKFSHEGCSISPSSFALLEEILYCKHHFSQLFNEKGSYLTTTTSSSVLPSSVQLLPLGN